MLSKEKVSAAAMADDGAATDQITREHIDNIRRKLADLNNKTPDNQEILLKFDELERTSSTGTAAAELRKRVVKLAQLIIKSGAKNALSGKMICELTDRLDELHCWLENDDNNRDQLGGDMDARCLIIRGHEGTFCSGSDLVTVRETTSQPLAWELAQVMQYNLARLEQLPLVSVAFVQGYALGGGAELVLGADMRLMSESARIGFVHAKNGICCGWGGGARLIELIGRSSALELLSSGRLVGPSEASRLGLCEGRAESLDEAIGWTLDHCIESRRACRAIKLLVNSSSRVPFRAALRLEAQLFASTWGKEAHLRGLSINLKHNK